MNYELKTCWSAAVETCISVFLLQWTYQLFSVKHIIFMSKIWQGWCRTMIDIFVASCTGRAFHWAVVFRLVEFEILYWSSRKKQSKIWDLVLIFTKETINVNLYDKVTMDFLPIFKRISDYICDPVTIYIHRISWFIQADYSYLYCAENWICIY